MKRFWPFKEPLGSENWKSCCPHPLPQISSDRAPQENKSAKQKQGIECTDKREPPTNFQCLALYKPNNPNSSPYLFGWILPLWWRGSVVQKDSPSIKIDNLESEKPESHHMCHWVHQNRASPLTSDFSPQTRYHRKFRSGNRLWLFHRARFWTGCASNTSQLRPQRGQTSTEKVED